MLRLLPIHFNLQVHHIQVKYEQYPNLPDFRRISQQCYIYRPAYTFVKTSLAI